MEFILMMKKGALVCAVGFLVACGGGGSGSGPAYNGKTEQAKITNDNADDMVGTTVGGSSPASGAANLSDGQTVENRQGATSAARGIRGVAMSATRQFKGSAGAGIAAIQPVNETINGNCGGTAVVTGTYDDAVFNVDLNAIFNNYCEDGDTLNGSASMKGRDDDINFEITMSFGNLSYRNNVDSIVANGSMAAVGTDLNYTVTLNFDFVDNVAGKSYRAENLKSVISEFADHYTASISGKAYHSDYGWVQIVTNKPLLIKHADGFPTDGEVKLNGDNSHAIATFNADGTYLLEIYDGTTTTKYECVSKTDACVPSPPPPEPEPA